ncbi:OB-fold protein [Xanthomonas cannabis]|uniref:OB-fold protein n=1 Tax=Xanthomonas cannabis TaxID=1885674 RepID=UPI00141B9B65|nr:SPOR domain-containing protein [Xanthomonas cannabis]NIK64390.1 hypothetical protein [Xanthomonas cannabis]
MPYNYGLFKGLLRVKAKAIFMLLAVPLFAEALELSAQRIGAPSRSETRSVPGGLVVTFGAYATRSDAEVVVARLRTAGLPGFHRLSTSNARDAWRVYVGPFPNESDAGNARLRALAIRTDVRADIIQVDAIQAEGRAALVGGRTEARTRIDAVDLFRAYADNEVLANQLYKGRTLLVTGEVRLIQSGINGRPLVVLLAGSRFDTVHVNGLSIAEATELVKGQSLTVACVGAGAVIGTPQLRECILH